MPTVMGILNVTPDSFSDGGRWLDPEAAIAHARTMVDEGAGIIDIGGESTRPGAEPVAPAEELRRVLPVIREVVRFAPVSIDTRHREVAEAAVDAGASIVNDVSASLDGVAAEGGAGWIAMHMRGEPGSMQAAPAYGDVVDEVRSFLVAAAERARAAGVEQIWIDPGIGFGKTATHNLSLLRRIDELVATGVPVAIGTSRKSFLGRIVARSGRADPADPASPANPANESNGSPDSVDSVDSVAPAPVDERLEAGLATVVWALAHGVDIVRVHDVRPAHHALRLATPFRAET